MASMTPETSHLASMNDTTQRLSPCVRLLIEILLNEAITRKGEMFLASDIKSEEIQAEVPTRERSLKP